MNEESKSSIPTSVQISRGIFLSWLFGMGLTQEKAECLGDEVIYHGIEKKFLLWRWTQVVKNVKLHDVIGIHDLKVGYPFLWILVGLSIINILASILNLGAWWNLQIWKLPYLWYGANAIIMFFPNHNWIYLHVSTGIFWSLIAFFAKRNFLVVDAHELSTIKIRTNGIKSESVAAFKAHLLEKWAKAKSK